MVDIILEPNLTPVISENNSWYITNQSAYFNWKINSAECSKLNGFFRGYQIILKVDMCLLYIQQIYIFLMYFEFFFFVSYKNKTTLIDTIHQIVF